jgi:AraC-like DNA-binding protein
MGQAWVDDKPYRFRTSAIDSIDELRVPVDGTDIEIVQLGRGRLSGQLDRATIGDVAFSKGSFSLPLCATGVLSSTHLTIGVLLGCSGTARSSSGVAHVGDIFINPAGVDHHNVYTGGARFAALLLDPLEMSKVCAGQRALSDPEFWSRQQHCHAVDGDAAATIERLMDIVMARLGEQKSWARSTLDFWKRSIVEVFASGVAGFSSDDSDSSVVPSTSRIVRNVENYVDARRLRPIHISEICANLKISRRTLHRAFEDVLGIGPSAFLRHKRLCSVHSALRQLTPEEARVTEVATEFGFLELGRFSQYYKRLFGEYPNETLRRPHA